VSRVARLHLAQSTLAFNAALHIANPRECESIVLACDKTRATLFVADQQAAGQRATKQRQ
jgi:hypothetical protein